MLIDGKRLKFNVFTMDGFYFLTGGITTFNILLDILGSYLLQKTYSWRNISNQQMIIFLVALCEAASMQLFLLFYLC